MYIGGESESDPEQSRDEYGSYANQNNRPRRHQLPFRVSPPPLALGVFMQSSGGKRFIVVRLGYHAPLCADASPLLHEQDAAEKVRLHVEPVEAVHTDGAPVCSHCGGLNAYECRRPNGFRPGLEGKTLDQARAEVTTPGTLAHKAVEDHINGRPETVLTGAGEVTEKARNAFAAYLHWEAMNRITFRHTRFPWRANSTRSAAPSTRLG